ncbi:hypothetical protein D9M72_498450 [compost metagenome]
MAKVLGQSLPEFGELTVRIAVQPRSSRGHGLGNGHEDIGRNAMGVFVDIEQDGNVQLRRTIRGEATQVGPEGKSVQAL